MRLLSMSRQSYRLRNGRGIFLTRRGYTKGSSIVVIGNTLARLLWINQLHQIQLTKSRAPLIRIDMATTQKTRSLSQALSQLLTNYLAGLIPDRKWRWIMDVLDSGALSRAERLEYVTAVNRSVGR